MTEDEVAQSGRVFRVWEDELGRSGGPYLAGALSLADLAFVPTVLRLTSHTEELGQWPLMKAWTERLLARETVQEWLQEAQAQPVVRLADYLS